MSEVCICPPSNTGSPYNAPQASMIQDSTTRDRPSLSGRAISIFIHPFAFFPFPPLPFFPFFALFAPALHAARCSLKTLWISFAARFSRASLSASERSSSKVACFASSRARSSWITRHQHQHGSLEDQIRPLHTLESQQISASDGM